MDETAPARSAWRQVCRQVEGPTPNRPEPAGAGGAGPALAAAVEYTRALSRPHLVELRVHARAVREPGLRGRIHRTAGRESAGHDSMTLDLLVRDPGGT